MTRTVGEIMYDVSVRMDDEGNQRFKPEVLRRFISEGSRQVAVRTECLRTSQAIPVAAQTAEVVGPTDAVRVTSAQFSPSGSDMVYNLEYMDRRSLDQQWGPWQNVDFGSYPSYWTTWSFPPALSIRMYPIPADAGTLTVFYYRLPAAIATNGDDDGNPIDLPVGWEEAVTDYASAMCAQKDRVTDLYAAYMADFQSKISALQETAVRFTDAAGQVDYWGGGGTYNSVAGYW